MAERLRSADQATIEAAVGRMERGLRDLGDMVWQLKGSIAASKGAGGALSVDIYEGFQVVGRSRLEEFRAALDGLIVTVRDPGSVAPVLGSEAQAGIMGGGHA